MSRLVRCLFIAMTAAWVPPALACSPATYQFYVFFDLNSAELSSQALSTIWGAGTARNGLRLPAACESFVVIGHTDAAEGAVPGTKLDIVRADAVRRALEVRGSRAIQVEGRLSQQLLVLTPPDAEWRNRRVWLKSTKESGGRARCDPSTINDQTLAPTTCGYPPKYGACYRELDDSTICNFDDVPEPNPERYSVIQ